MRLYFADVPTTGKPEADKYIPDFDRTSLVPDNSDITEIEESRI